jgi:hypothetical protein
MKTVRRYPCESQEEGRNHQIPAQTASEQAHGSFGQDADSIKDTGSLHH